MQYIISGLIIIIPALGMLAGLINSLTISIFLFILLITNKKKLNFKFVEYKLEILFLSWCFLSCFWSIQIKDSLNVFLQLFTIVFATLVLKRINLFEQFSSFSIPLMLLIGIISSITLFYVEYYSNGLLTRNFKLLFYKNNSADFALYSLDRGCALLSLTCWLMIAIYCEQQKKYKAIFLYIIVLYLLMVSDSLASLVGFLVSGLSYIIGRIKKDLLKFISFILLSGSLLMPICAFQINPQKIATNVSSKILPNSAKHRLYIWNFVAKKIFQQPVIGYGLASSKKFKINDDEIINYEGQRWSPLPLHPHNNILQILFETGIIGYIIFFLLMYKYLVKIEDKTKVNINVGLISYACFVNYYIIGMISYNIWQTWWMCTGAWIAIMVSLINNAYSANSIIKSKDVL